MPRPPLRRSRLKARIAAAYGTLRVLEQALRAASSALALGQGDMASCAAYVGRDASRYFSGKPGLLQVYPGFTRGCPESGGKSYHRLIVLAGECLIVLGGYTGKWQALASPVPSVEEPTIFLLWW